MIPETEVIYGKRYSESDMHFIIQAYLRLGQTKQRVWETYTGQKEEHGQIIKWMRKLGYGNDEAKNRIATFDPNYIPMAKRAENEAAESSAFQRLQLEKRVALLEQQLKDAEMKVIAYSTMVDLAEKEFRVPIRKKFNTKP